MLPARPEPPPADAALDALRARLITPDAGVPVLPELASQVVALAGNPDTPVWSLAGVVSRDPVLAARLLGLANSAYCAPLQPIATVTDAIVRMGAAAVRNLVVTVCLASNKYDARIYGAAGRSIVDHGVGAAYLARLVAERAGVNPDEAFLAGLLHDIGKLVILKARYDLLAAGVGPVAEDALQEVIADEHARVGGQCLTRWQVPIEIAEPVAWHHDPADAAAPVRRAAIVVYVADLLAHRYGFGCDAERDLPVLADPLAREAGLDDAWLADADRHASGLFEVAKTLLG